MSGSVVVTAMVLWRQGCGFEPAGHCVVSVGKDTLHTISPAHPSGKKGVPKCKGVWGGTQFKISLTFLFITMKIKISGF